MNLCAAVECLLFVSGDPVSLEDLSRALHQPPDVVAEALAQLASRLSATESGLEVVSIAGGYQLSTRPEHAETVGSLVGRSASRLSRAALETIAVIAYRQPVTQPEVEAVRGVSCDGILRKLLERDLIVEAGRKVTVGRPILYATTPAFLIYFGLNCLDDLPELDAPDNRQFPQRLAAGVGQLDSACEHADEAI